MKGLTAACTSGSEKRISYFQISSSLFCLSQFPAGIKWINSLSWYCTKRKKSVLLIFFYISFVFKFRLQVLSIVFLLCHSTSVGMSWKRTTSGRRDVELLWNKTQVCGMSALFSTVLCIPLFTLALCFTVTGLNKNQVVSLVRRKTVSTLQQQSHYKWRGDGTFCLASCVSLKAWHKVTHQAQTHNCLFRIGELLVFHLKSASIRFHH